MRTACRLLVFSAMVGACAPLPLLQDARIVPGGTTRYGVGGGLIVSLDPETVYEPDGKSSAAETIELQYTPLPFLAGWGRVGLGGGGELQVGFQLPSFAISLGGKYGLLGRAQNSPASLAISADLSVSPVMVDWGAGGSLHASFRLVDGISLDVTGRFGTWVGQWHTPAVTATLGVTIDDDHTEQWHVVAGWAQPVPIPGLSGRSIQAGFLSIAWTK